jgi:hypothetical protein
VAPASLRLRAFLEKDEPFRERALSIALAEMLTMLLLPPAGGRGDAARGDRARGTLPGAHFRGRVPGLQGKGAPLGLNRASHPVPAAAL